MKSIRLKRKPFFYEDLNFSHWLMQDRLLGIVLDRQNRVEEIRMDAKQFLAIKKELRASHYL